MQTGREDFGVTAGGAAVERVTLAAGDLTVRLLTFGAALQDVRLAGVPHGLTIGSEDLSLYETGFRYHGMLVGPVANRLSGSSAVIAEVRHEFQADPGGAVILHSGPAGTHRKLWRLVDLGADHATMAVDLPHGEGGFSGNRQVSVTYRVSAPATLRMEMRVTADRPTLVSFANHAYWNLDGSETWIGHRLQIAADRYLPCTPEVIPTGEIASVEGTPFDFRVARVAARGEPPLDTCFCFADARRGLTEVLTLTGQSGVRMRVATTEPGVQLYDGRVAAAPGRPEYEALVIEPQLWPDAPGRAGFPSIELARGEVYAPVSEWRFDRV